jgi:hypothetical protein
MGDCTIITCFSGNTPHVYNSDCPNDATRPPDLVIVSIDQQCTPVLDGQPLTCIYPGPNKEATKNKIITASCDQGSPQICSTTDPYGAKFAERCDPPGTVGGDPVRFTCHVWDFNHPSSTGSDLWIEKCSGSTPNTPFQHCDIIAEGTNLSLARLDCNVDANSQINCTVKDENNNQMTLTCVGSPASRYCYFPLGAQTPECPATSGPSTAAVAVTESTIVCSTSLIINHMLSNVGSGGSGQATIVYPLSQAELLFVLQKLGIGALIWPQQQNLPKIDHL